MKRHHILATAALVFAFAATPAAAQSALGQVTGQPAEEATRFPNARAHPFNEVNMGTRTPRFVLELLSVHADHESGATNLGDDEISILIHAGNYWTVTEMFEDFDNYETREIAANQSCIYPARDTDGFNRAWGCDINGGADPGVITLQVREHEEPLFDPFGLEDICILPNTLTSDLLATPHHCIAEDTIIGSYDIDLHDYGLPSSLQQGESRETEMTFGNDQIGQYTVRYRITRTYDIVDAGTPLAVSH